MNERIFGNLRDLALNNAPVLLVAVGMTLVILVGEIDISVGSQFAVCSVAAGWLAKEGVPVALLLPSVLLLGALMGALNGALVGYLRLPSIIVTLAMLVAWRDALRWVTQGEWVQNLPPNFQWFVLGQTLAQWLIVATQRPASFVANVTPSAAPAWKTIPSWAVLGTDDLVIPIATQRRMAERANATVTEVDASHVSMVSRPEVTLAAIRAAAASIE